MIDNLDDFFSNDRYSSYIVGGCAGTFVFKYMIESAMNMFPFDKILVVEGCQDYIGLLKDSLNNHYYYADLFVDEMINPSMPYDAFKASWLNPKPEYIQRLNTPMTNNYDCMIIKDAHLIPRKFIEEIFREFSGKVGMIVDPFDIDGEIFDVPTVIDTLNKLSPIIAMARSMYDIETRAVDKCVRGNVTESKINKRSIGKMDDKQYITNDESLCDIIRHKQYQSSFRKHQKLFVTDKKINMNVNFNHRGHALTNNSMVVIDSSTSRPLMKLRIYSSKIIYASDVSYSENNPAGTIRVKPANILMINESHYHRYNHSVLICNGQLTKRQMYSILKNSNNITVGHLN